MNGYESVLKSLGCQQLFESSALPLSETRIETIEEQIGVKLPAAYREFIATCSGFHCRGYLLGRVLEQCPAGEIVVVSVFFGDFDVPGYEIVTNHSAYLGRIPSNLLPVAVDPGGNLICIVTYGAMQGAVYFWDSVDEVKQPQFVSPGGNKDGNVYLMASTFDEFIDSLTLEEAKNDANSNVLWL